MLSNSFDYSLYIFYFSKRIVIELAGGGSPSWVTTFGPPDCEKELKPPEVILTFEWGLFIMLVVAVCCMGPAGLSILSEVE